MSALAFLLVAGGFLNFTTINWTYEANCVGTWGTATNITACIWTGTQWVLGGASSTGGHKTVTASADGTTYTQREDQGEASIEAFGTNGSGTVLMGTTYGVFRYSTDYGSTWTTNSGMTGNWYGSNLAARCIKYANSKWVIVGDNGRAAYTTTPTGGLTAGNISGWTSNIYGVDYGNSVWVCVGSSGQCATSSDGQTWTTNTGLSSLSVNSFLSIAFGNGVFVAVSNGGAVAVSSNGTTWALGTGVWGTAAARRIVFGNGYFMVVADGGIVALSKDGLSWSAQTGLSSTSWGTATPYALAYDSTNKHYFVAGAAGKGAMSSNS